MILVAFRQTGCDPWCGVAAAHNLRQLYFQIDQHIDPNICEIKRIPSASIIFKLKEEDPEDEFCGESFVCCDNTTLEESEEIMMAIADQDAGWYTPKWPKNLYRI